MNSTSGESTRKRKNRDLSGGSDGGESGKATAPAMPKRNLSISVLLNDEEPTPSSATNPLDEGQEQEWLRKLPGTPQIPGERSEASAPWRFGHRSISQPTVASQTSSGTASPQKASSQPTSQSSNPQVSAIDSQVSTHASTPILTTPNRSGHFSSREGFFALYAMKPPSISLTKWHSPHKHRDYIPNTLTAARRWIKDRERQEIATPTGDSKNETREDPSPTLAAASRAVLTKLPNDHSRSSRDPEAAAARSGSSPSELLAREARKHSGDQRFKDRKDMCIWKISRSKTFNFWRRWTVSRRRCRRKKR